MAWAPQAVRWKPVSGKNIARQQDGRLRPGASARDGLWSRMRQFLLRPGWRNLPLAAFLVFAAGAIPGPPAVLFYGWLLNVHWDQVLKTPHMIFVYAALGGACHALGMYLLCILPLEYLWPRLHSYSRAVRYAAIVGFALLGASSATFTSFSRLKAFWGGARSLAAAPPPSRLAIFSLVVAISASFLIVIWRTMITEAKLREQTLAEAAALSQAQALQAQINPHFFFNTLTTISALTELDGRAAKELVGQLAELFRYTLSCSKFELVTIEQELEFVSNYLLIEQARFGRRLRFEMPPSQAGRDILMPGLTLQPLVENAVRHGIAKRRDGGLIRILLECNQSVCTLTVANQIALSEGLPVFRPVEFFRPGHALANTRDRLSLAFRGRASLKVMSAGGEWVKVMIKLPLMEESV